MTDLNRWREQALGVLRIVAGFLFFQHGAQKLFGWFGGQTVELASIYGAAGIIEVVGGTLIALGLFTRIAAFVAAGEMAAAFFIAHLPEAFWPIQNNGEPAVLFCFIFLYLVFAGPGALALDRLRGRRAAVPG